MLLRFYLPEISPFSALFHAVSAFCNAGFSLFSTSFQQFRSDIFINCLITALIISGGLGFLVLYDISRWLRFKVRKKDVRLALHTKIVLSVSIILIILGTLFLLVAENQSLFGGYAFKDRILASYFQSVSARTAGFNTVEINSLRPGSKLFVATIMFIGASPGSTGGGIKTVTFALVLVGIITLLKGKKQIRLFRRAIPLQLIDKAVVIFVLSLIWIIFATILLLFIENKTSLNLFFEVVSAFGTVGLSSGITPDLTTLGKFIIILTMFFGRIGPMTLAIALAKRDEADFKLPEENVMVG